MHYFPKPSAVALPSASHRRAVDRNASLAGPMRRSLTNGAARIGRPAGELILWLALVGWLLFRKRL